MQEHYFSQQPSVKEKPKVIDVKLNGKEYKLQTSSGTFSPGHLDTGTKTLLDEVPAATGDIMLDVGCGWGPLALTMALQSPQAKVYAIDVNERSLELTQSNADFLGRRNIIVGKPENLDPKLEFDLIWSNPPIKVGKQELHHILQMWLPRLKKGGSAYLVVAKKLGAESLLKWLQAEFSTMECSRFARNKGFHVLKVQN
ncbi:MAG: methyltransferase [Micrococcaceae bacterium]